jgi:hypothetical protein
MQPEGTARRALKRPHNMVIAIFWSDQVDYDLCPSMSHPKIASPDRSTKIAPQLTVLIPQSAVERQIQVGYPPKQCSEKGKRSVSASPANATSAPNRLRSSNSSGGHRSVLRTCNESM